ncbi:MAG: sulfurtransferase TusA family protein [Pseudomonadales bacterium]|nr:sulfurtransferase TusA family protein [Pseudomonadales bacterium]
MSTFQLNAENLLCPMPVIRTQDKIATLQSGDILEVTCTDPGVLSDIPAWCRINGHKLLDSGQTGRIITLEIEVVHEEED